MSFYVPQKDVAVNIYDIVCVTCAENIEENGGHTHLIKLRSGPNISIGKKEAKALVKVLADRW